MALQSFTVSIGALSDANNNDKNYVSGEAIYVKTIGGSFALIFRDLAGASEIAQDGLANQTDDNGQFTFFVEVGDYILEYQNQSTPVTIVGPDYFNSRIEESVNQIIIDTATSRGFRVVGDFAGGFTYELANDVAADGSGNYWVYADTGALPVTVTAGTTPSEPTCTQVTFNQASGVTTTAGINAQQFIDNFELKIFQSPTDNLIKVETFSGGVGVVYEVRKTSDNSLATIYSDKDGVTSIPQNGTANVSNGDAEVVFYIDDGDYTVTIDGVSSGFVVGYYDRSDIRRFGASAGQPCNDSIYAAISKTGIASIEPNAFDVELDSPINVPSNSVVNFKGANIAKSLGFVPNSDKTLFNHAGDNGKVLNVSYPDVAADERLIGYQGGANGCVEDGCSTGRGNSNLIKFQSGQNTNISRTLESYSMLGNTYSEKTIKVIVDAASGGAPEFRRSRFFPSYCKIKSIKVTDLNGSPDFDFELSMRDGAGFSSPFSRARDSSNISVQVDIDWLYDSSDDILSFVIGNYKGSASKFEVEISYVNGMFGSLSSVWSYQSELDFLRPHEYGAATKAEAIRSPEYRSHIDGVGLDVATAIPSRAIDDNYNLPSVTMPTPAGVQDTSQSSEIKFYFKVSAGDAISSGATHALFRLYQSNRQIKCTVINGFLAQAPDWVTESHLAVSFQPDIEIDWPIQSDRDNPQELLIPLDKKMLQQASQQAERNDFEYYYLTFFANLPSHVAIEWGDIWEWDFQFIKQ